MSLYRSTSSTTVGVRERRTGYWRFARERTADESILQFYESSGAVSVEKWSNGVCRKDERANFVKVWSVLATYRYDIHEAKEILSMLHDVAVKSPCIRCMFTEEDIISVEMSGDRSVQDIKMLKSRFLEIRRKDTGCMKGRNDIPQKRAIIQAI